MGAKYEVRWKVNGKCPFWSSVWTDSLIKALVAYVKADRAGNTRVELIMHDYKECPSDCEHREHLCPGGDA